jgi:uncharacterized protein
MVNPPRFKGFKPFGFYGKESDAVILHFEELEVIRLLDYENMNQEAAAKIMDVSRPTLTRIYESARNKVATAFAEARTILVEKGTVYFDNDWFRCMFCNSTFNNPDLSKAVESCPMCGGNKLEQLNSTDDKHSGS